MIKYTCIFKDPPVPADNKKKKYKEFEVYDFLNDLKDIDWCTVYECKDVDMAVDVSTNMFLLVLNQHAPFGLSFKFVKR